MNDETGLKAHFLSEITPQPVRSNTKLFRVSKVKTFYGNPIFYGQVTHNTRKSLQVLVHTLHSNNGKSCKAPVKTSIGTCAICCRAREPFLSFDL